MDEECNFPGATNETLHAKFTHNHKGNPYYQVPQLKEGAFIIVHYAGKVKYLVKVSTLRRKEDAATWE
jgi:myosin-9